MSTETKEKKLYPSQINTKTISARIPVTDYVKFLQESLSNGISLNDWLLMKIYGNSNSVGNEIIDNETKEINNDSILRITENELKKYNPATYQYWADDFQEGYIDFSAESIFDLLEDVRMKAFFLQHLNKQIHTKREASLQDVKTQLTVLIKNRIDDSKEQREYRKELFELLDELA